MSVPLWKKLGIKPGSNVILHNVPEDYYSMMDNRLDECTVMDVKDASESDFIHLFAKDLKAIVDVFDILKSKLKKEGIFWVSWPKKSSGYSSDLDKMALMDYGLSNGLVDVKVASYDGDWSCLKFVYRLKDR